MSAEEDMRVILNMVAEDLHVSPETLQHKDRKFIWPRSLVMWLTRMCTDVTYKKIAVFMGYKSHVSVLNGVYWMDRLYSQGPHTTRVYLKEVLKKAMTLGSENRS